MRIFLDSEKSIKNLQTKAKKGNFFSAYQLYEYYKEGKFVTKSKVMEKKYLDLAYSIFSNQKISLDSIKIENFKVFNEIRITEFDKNLNIFVGSNGAGKTTILDAISMSLSWLVNAISKNGGVGASIDESDINVYSDLPFSNITTSISFNEKINANLELSQSKDGVHKKKNYLLDIRKVGAFYKVANEIDNGFNMPLFAYYNVLRSYDVSSKDMNISVDSIVSDNFDKFKGYNFSLSGKTDFSSFVEWFKALDDIDARRKLVSFESMKTEGFSKELFDSISELINDNAEASEKLKMLLTSLPLTKEINRVKDFVNIESKVTNISKIKDAINSAIELFMDGYGSLELVLEPKLDLIIKKNGQKISVLKLSQGEKTLLSLIVDIAMRLFLLNPTLDNPLEGEGIILIDEFDLHLHPKWQREIVKNLPVAFPNCQFFLTTHSPLVLGEVKPSQIYIFYIENDEITIRKPKQSYGLTSNDILNELMITGDGLEQLSRNAIVEDSLNNIFSLIEKETKSSLLMARREIKKLEGKVFGDIPELIEAKVKIDFIDWELNEKN